MCDSVVVTSLVRHGGNFILASIVRVGCFVDPPFASVHTRMNDTTSKDAKEWAPTAWVSVLIWEIRTLTNIHILLTFLFMGPTIESFKKTREGGHPPTYRSARE